MAFPKLDKNFINSMSASLRIFTTQYTQTIDPLLFFATFNFMNVLTLFANIEVSLNSSSANNILRETLVNQPAIGPAVTRTNMETQIIRNRNTNAVLQDSIRERDRFIIVITPIIWVISAFYAFHPIWRDRFITKLKNCENVPKVTVEFFKRTRHSTNGVTRILTNVSFTSFNVLVNLYPQIKDTYYDPNFLGSEIGLQSVANFFSFLAKAEGNYIPFVNTSNTNLPTFESGTITTFGSLSKASADFLEVSVFALQGNSYSNDTFIITHVLDCNLLHTTYVNSSGIQVVNQAEYAYQIDTQTTLLGAVQYIVERVTGVTPNPRPSTEGSTPRSSQQPQQQGNGLNSNTGAALGILLGEFIVTLSEALLDTHLNASIRNRIKRLIGLYHKLNNSGYTLGELII